MPSAPRAAKPRRLRRPTRIVLIAHSFWPRHPDWRYAPFPGRETSATARHNIGFESLTFCSPAALHCREHIQHNHGQHVAPPVRPPSRITAVNHEILKANGFKLGVGAVLGSACPGRASAAGARFAAKAFGKLPSELRERALRDAVFGRDGRERFASRQAGGECFSQLQPQLQRPAACGGSVSEDRWQKAFIFHGPDSAFWGKRASLVIPRPRTVYKVSNPK